MRMSISKKLIGGFLCLALLVLLSGVVGIVVLDKVSASADMVAMEKAPTQYAVMNAALAVDTVQKHMIDYTGSVFNLSDIAAQIDEGMETFHMWIFMLQYGSASREFHDSQVYATYKGKNLDIAVPRCSTKMLPVVSKIVEGYDRLHRNTSELEDAHKELVSYGVIVDSQMFTLPDFLNLAQRNQLEWIRQLKDAVNIETKFTGNTDPAQGLIGEWLESYQVPNQELMALHAKFKKQYIKMMKMAEKINSLTVFKDKQRALNRGIGVTSKIERYFNDLHALSKTIYSQLQANNRQKQAELSASVSSINNELDNLIAMAGDEMQTALRDAAGAKKKGVTLLIVLTIIAVIAAAVLGTLVSRYMSANILSIAESTKQIAAGDLQKDIDIKANDELGDLADDTNSMIANLRRMIGQILSFSEKLTGSAKELGGISKDLDGNAANLEDKSKAASEATTTMNSSMVDISTLANDSMQRVQSVALATEEMSATIAEIAENAEQARSVTSKAVSTVENTTVKMNELSDAATEIGKVADVIVSIAEQTNLLSLNATIEAARAGEAGKGFAVVANEVKELAGQTNQATEDIRQKIKAIQQSSDMAIGEITEITGIINDINAIVVVIAGAVEEQATTTKQITDDINSVSGGIEGMTEHVDSATRISDGVAADIDQVKSTSKNIGEGSSHIQSKANELENLATELNRLVGQFKL